MNTRSERERKQKLYASRKQESYRKLPSATAADDTQAQEDSEEAAAEAERRQQEKVQKELAQAERYLARNDKRRDLELQTQQEKKTRSLIGDEFIDKLERKLAQYAVGSKTREGAVIMEDSDEDREESEKILNGIPQELQSG